MKNDSSYISPVIIPPTSPTRYIGGTAALNIICEEPTGDWHMFGHFHVSSKKRARSFISGEGCETNTNHLLGTEGIYDCSEQLKDMRVRFEGERAYAASHARATADLVLNSVMRNKSPDWVVLDDWMPRDQDKQQVFDLLDKAGKLLSPNNAQVIAAWKDKNTGDQEW